MGEWNYFNVAGVTFPNDHNWKGKNGKKLSRLDLIQRYTSVKSKFKPERDKGIEGYPNAIRIRQIFVSGNSIILGYVPNNPECDLASELAPLMDAGQEIEVRFSQRFVDQKTGDIKGLQLRYRLVD